MGNIKVSNYWQNKGLTSDEQVAEYRRNSHAYYALISQKRKHIKQNKDQHSEQIRKIFLSVIGNIEHKNEKTDEFINKLFEQFSLRERSIPKKKL